MSDAAPIIVKKIKKGGHGHHGGAWKVAFADFTTAMMAFFLLLWLLAAGTEEQKGSISKYFKNPSDLVGTSSNPSKASVVLGGQAGSMSIVSLTDTNIPNIAGATEGYGSEEGEDDSDDGEDGSDADDKQAENEALVSELRELIEKSPELKDHAEQMLIDITPEGLRLQIVDEENRPMFELGDASMKSHTEEILGKLATVLKKPRRKLSITGHTDARVLATKNYTNWELSTDRANAARRILVDNGLAIEDIERVVGLADRVPLDKTDAQAAINRRISIILLNDPGKKTSESGADDDSEKHTNEAYSRMQETDIQAADSRAADVQAGEIKERTDPQQDEGGSAPPPNN